MSFLEALGGHISYLFPGKVQGSPVCLSSASAAQGPKQHRCLFLWAGNTFRASFFLLLMHLLVVPRSLSPGHWFPVLETCSHVPESASSRESACQSWRREPGGVYRPKDSFQFSLLLLFQSKLVVCFKSALARVQQDLLRVSYKERSKRQRCSGGSKRPCVCVSG